MAKNITGSPPLISEADKAIWLLLSGDIATIALLLTGFAFTQASLLELAQLAFVRRLLFAAARPQIAVFLNNLLSSKARDQSRCWCRVFPKYQSKIIPNDAHKRFLIFWPFLSSSDQKSASTRFWQWTSRTALWDRSAIGGAGIPNWRIQNLAASRLPDALFPVCVGRCTKHAGQICLYMTLFHVAQEKLERGIDNIRQGLQTVRRTAERFLA
ncbi:hypothetical protein [Acidithiobacillus sp. AMEEHan]|uniref:hypothetical protein n=1 Tax=Acidithiobacillus sp. AMEEHan TaxID=2994951 RepID=UPI0027E53C42|nr:hypothetical protein [Acidithiobacillus sp. AMEEHan]